MSSILDKMRAIEPKLTPERQRELDKLLICGPVAIDRVRTCTAPPALSVATWLRKRGPEGRRVRHVSERVARA